MCADRAPQVGCPGTSKPKQPTMPTTLGLQEKLHFYTGQLNDVVIAQLMRLRVEGLTVEDRKVGPFYMGNEIPVWPFCNNSDLNTWFTECGQRLCQRQFLTGIWTRQYLNGPASLGHSACSSHQWCGRNRSRIRLCACCNTGQCRVNRH